MTLRGIDAVFFDLDGTLADTAIDLSAALNRVLAEEEREPLNLKEVKEIASNGSVALIEAGFQIDKYHPHFRRYQQRLLNVYRDCLTDHPNLMPGMHAVLMRLDAIDIPWGIVTNKPTYLTAPLVAAMPLPRSPACIVSGDTVAKSKPHPDSLLHACKLLKVTPENCIYIGDAKRDIQAGRAAGMQTITALFGYISNTDTPQAWGAHLAINDTEELLKLF